MIYATYNLNTLKDQAKRLKRLKKSEGLKVTHMECLDNIAQLHNAESWNCLYKAHAKALKKVNEHSEFNPEADPLVFIEDLTFKRKLKLIESIQRQLSEKGFDDTFVGKYTEKVLFTYAPTSSKHFMEDLMLENADSEDLHKQRFTSLDDMYGHLFVASDKSIDHVDFLKQEVIPTCLRSGGLLVISESQYKKTKHLLTGKNVRKITMTENAIKTPLKWSGRVDVDTLNKFYVNSIFGLGEGAMHEGRAAIYFKLFFDVWEKIGAKRLHPNDISNFSLETLSRMINMLSPSEPLKRKVLGNFNDFFKVETTAEGRFNILPPLKLEYFDYLTMLQDGLHGGIINSSANNAITLDTLFDDLSQTTILVLSDLTKTNKGRLSLEKTFASGIMIMLQERLIELRRQRILDGTSPLLKFLIYTSPDSHAVQREHHKFSFMFGSIVKSVVSILRKPNGSHNARLFPDDVDCSTSKFSDINEIEYSIIKNKATHIIDLGRLAYKD